VENWQGHSRSLLHLTVCPISGLTVQMIVRPHLEGKNVGTM
jgi:hypothetical protein